MRSYGIYYSYKAIGDVVIVMFDNLPATRSENKGRVTVIYNGNNVIGYNIYNVKEVIKIKNEGLIHLPSSALVEVLNTMLINAEVTPLDIFEHSGYYTAQVVEINGDLITLSTGINTYATKSKQPLKVNDKVVLAKAGTHLASGEIVKDENGVNAYICTYSELGINADNDNVLVLEDDIELGKDFFSSEVR